MNRWVANDAVDDDGDDDDDDDDDDAVSYTHLNKLKYEIEQTCY